MALIKPITNPYGSTTNYWIVQRVELFPQIKRANIGLSGWVSENARNTPDTKPIEFREYHAITEDYDQYFDDSVLLANGSSPQKQAYVFIKNITDGEFSNAQDG